MLVRIGELNVALLGDAHLGKKFDSGTPLHRRGDRQRTQWADLSRSLFECDGVDVHVQMGDLFDQWYVSFDVIMKAATLYREAAARNPTTEYFILQGNHDASRDLERTSAFALFAGLVRGLTNVTVVKDAPVKHRSLVFLPWSPVLSALEVVADNEGMIEHADAVFGHWDVVAIGESSNLIPAAQLKALNVKRALTGHDHTRRELVLEGLPILVTGSMQPYSHAEDPSGDLYVTVSLADVEADPAAFKDKCVRIRLQPGESLKEPLDCLQLQIQPASVTEDEDDEEVEFSAFNFEALFSAAMEDVDPEFALIAKDRWELERAKQ